jgi:hypothetical protein
MEAVNIRNFLSISGRKKGENMKRTAITIQNALAMVKQTGGDKLFLGFLIFYLIDCIFLLLFDESIETYQDALWLGFNIATSVGLGDYTVTTVPARMAAVLLGIYGAVIVAYIPGLAASLYIQKLNETHDKMLKMYQEELSKASTLSSEQKKKIAAQIRKGKVYEKS